jgi:hypothetical protein
MSYIYTIKLNLKNIPGKRLKNKYVVLDCDDWGGIRMPSKKVYQRLLEKGISVDKSRFNIDTIASADDLEQLFEVLCSVKDANGHHAIMTPVTNMANPDFERIKSGGFEKYYYESFTETLKHYYPNNDVFNLWKQGIEAGIFIPELHGREHISVQLWLEKLREGNKNLHFAFDNEFVAISLTDLHPELNGFRPEFFFNSNSQIPFLENSIVDATDIFTNIFGYKPRAFVPSNAVFHPIFEKVVASAGIKFLYVDRSMLYPSSNGVLKRKRYIPWSKGNGGLRYYTRNCAFEPISEGYTGIEFTLHQISAAFKWGKPAFISSHRANFVGGVVPENRINGLKELKKLLSAIVKKWPDAVFISSGDFLESYI